MNTATLSCSRKRTADSRLFVRLVSLLIMLAMALTAWGQLKQPPPGPFDMVGLIQSATMNGPAGCVLCGGTIKINNIVITVPVNTIVEMPATALSWGQVFSQNPTGNVLETGMALADAQRLPVGGPPATYEAHVQGNIVNGQYIAGLIFLAQHSLNLGSGFIDSIDYTKGELHIMNSGGVSRVQINDPIGRFGLAHSPDTRFTMDEDNPTVRSITAFPMCVQRTDPKTADDQLCPSANRPRDNSKPGGFATIINMAAPGVGPTDPTKQMPLEPGDYVTFAGVLAHDDAGDYVSAYQVLANVGVYTAPNTDPAYVAIDVIEQGTGGVTNPNFPQEDSARVRVEGFTTDPSRSLNITAVDTDCNGVATDRTPFWVSGLAADPGPPTGAVLGRYRFRPNTGPFLPPAREVRVSITGATRPFVANGIVAGQYRAPDFTFIFPENLGIGNPPVPLNLQDFVWLVNGIGPWDASNVVGQLAPWPGDTTPATTCTSTGPPPPNPPPPPVASAVATPTTIGSGGVVQLDGSASIPLNQISYSWLQNPADTTRVALINPTSAVASFVAPVVLNSVTVSFTLTVTNASGSSSAIVAVIINPPPPPQPPVAVATASPNPVASGGTVSLIGTGSSDPNSLPLTYLWTQTGGTPVTITNPTGAVASFVSPIIQPGNPAGVMSFSLQVTNSAGLSSTAGVSVTINPQPDVPVITAATYTKNKTRMVVNVTDNVVSATITMTCSLDIINPATNQP
ncbi:MAG TPA: hypothetical protein VF532_20960, partial [Candidatus Angelobacter sp.]